MLTTELLAFQQRHLGSSSASLPAETLDLQLFGYITLVKDGHSIGRLHAVNYWKGGTKNGKFNGVRIKPSSGRSKDLQFARLLLVFTATLIDGNVYELALVRHHQPTGLKKTISGVECTEVYLKETSVSVILLTDIVDSWSLFPDFRVSFSAAAANPNQLVAGNYLI